MVGQVRFKLKGLGGLVWANWFRVGWMSLGTMADNMANIYADSVKCKFAKEPTCHLSSYKVQWARGVRMRGLS